MVTCPLGVRPRGGLEVASMLLVMWVVAPVGWMSAVTCGTPADLSSSTPSYARNPGSTMRRVCLATADLPHAEARVHECIG